MRIAFVFDTFHREMGYLENCLPPHLAMMGHDVHILTSPLAPYYWTGSPEKILGKFVQACNLKVNTIESYEGCSLHVLEHGMILRRVYLKGLGQKLRQIRPDVVQICTPIGPIALSLAGIRLTTRFALFTGNHQGFSTFATAQRPSAIWSPERAKIWLTRGAHGRLIAQMTELCYAITSDSGEVAWRFFGVPRDKVKIVHLGSDTRYFHPVRSQRDQESRIELRSRWGVSENEILCVFTGKMDEFRNPLLLAQAVMELKKRGEPFQAVFVGAGPQRQAVETLGFRVLDFMPFKDLGPIYRASDIAVWPGPESISQLDAAACGLPLVVGDIAHYRDHVDGNGLVYQTGDQTDLMRTLMRLRNLEMRKELGVAGALKIERSFSWKSISAQRSADYTIALQRNP